jgi:hypothetical protein
MSPVMYELDFFIQEEGLLQGLYKLMIFPERFSAHAREDSLWISERRD